MKPDTILFVANLVIAVSLLPSILSKDKPHKNTSLLNVFVSLIFITGYINAQFFLAVWINVLIGTMWLTLLVQKLTSKA